MKIKDIKLSWFRGAAESAVLDLGLKSVVVYGENGAGKSSFVDSIEYILNQGRIGHLAHEHSGKKQEKAIINTHTPAGQSAGINVQLADAATVSVKILPNGNFSITPDSPPMTSWNYQRTVLRQNEVSDFVTHTKGDKYSALLPLLGLSHLEVIAENLRQLEKAIVHEADISSKKKELQQIEIKRKEIFGENDDNYIYDEGGKLYKKYIPGKAQPSQPEELVQEVSSALQSRISKLSGDQATHATLRTIASSSIKKDIEAVRSGAVKLSESVEPFIMEKLATLGAASVYADKIETTEELKCPACGQHVSSDLFQAHIKNEKARLQVTLENYDAHKINIATLCDSLLNLRSAFGKAEVKSWRESCDPQAIKYVTTLDINGIRASCTEDILKSCEEKLFPIILAAETLTKNAPPEIKELLDDQEKSKTIETAIQSKALQEEVNKSEALVGFVNALEKKYRERIKSQSTEVVNAISDDIARMWGILHPNEKVDGAHLYLPDDADKAIEIGLKFYGISQLSPRLTLSEGHRNSLGLCIFLAMVKRDTSLDQPLFLDDVVVSFDRNHRGMVPVLLEKEFAGKQIILLTHDRDWFTELKLQLPGQDWNFQALMPWNNPEVGITWSAVPSTFGDARALLDSDPDLAGNRARKIMDISLALIAEKLKIELPYLHREKNDHRTAHDFLSRIIGQSGKGFQIKVEGVYQPHTEATALFESADKLLVSTANKASHTLDVVRNEVSRLIDACEAVLGIFKCLDCGKNVFKLDDASAKVKQCGCGKLRWKY